MKKTRKPNNLYKVYVKSQNGYYSKRGNKSSWRSTPWVYEAAINSGFSENDIEIHEYPMGVYNILSMGEIRADIQQMESEKKNKDLIREEKRLIKQMEDKITAAENDILKANEFLKSIGRDGVQ